MKNKKNIKIIAGILAVLTIVGTTVYISGSTDDLFQGALKVVRGAKQTRSIPSSSSSTTTVDPAAHLESAENIKLEFINSGDVAQELRGYYYDANDAAKNPIDYDSLQSAYDNSRSACESARQRWATYEGLLNQIIDLSNSNPSAYIASYAQQAQAMLDGDGATYGLSIGYCDDVETLYSRNYRDVGDMYITDLTGTMGDHTITLVADVYLTGNGENPREVMVGNYFGSGTLNNQYYFEVSGREKTLYSAEGRYNLIFTFNISEYPDAWDAFVSEGEISMEIGLAIDVDNESEETNESNNSLYKEISIS